jgi:hypothetical protein
MITRDEALEKASFHIGEADKAFSDASVGKHLSLVQLYLTFAHELNTPASLVQSVSD